MVKGPGVGGEGRGDLGVRFDRLNELREAAGKVLEPVERAGAVWESGSPFGVRFYPSILGQAPDSADSTN